MKRGLILFSIAAIVAWGLPLRNSGIGMLNAGAEGEASLKAPAETATAGQPLNAARAAREEKALQEARRQQIAEKEAALAAKDAELKKLNEKLDGQIKAFEESKRRLDDSLKVQKKVQDDKRKKMIGFFKKMKAEQAGQLMNKLDEGLVIAMLDQMDTKTVIKLVPFLSQPRVLKWINENLKGV
ncbi:MAG TPA: hypothetical protein VGJ93_06555 [Desulfuromonadaceae bacterium]|jgi:flagellar motility protein MotE (MotC chaperone)